MLRRNFLKLASLVLSGTLPSDPKAKWKFRGYVQELEVPLPHSNEEFSECPSLERINNIKGFVVDGRQTSFHIVVGHVISSTCGMVYIKRLGPCQIDPKYTRKFKNQQLIVGRLIATIQTDTTVSLKRGDLSPPKTVHSYTYEQRWTAEDWELIDTWIEVHA